MEERYAEANLRRETLSGGHTLLLGENSFPLTGDSVELAEFAGLRPGDRVCDLGCGVGTLPVLLAQRGIPFICCAVELDPREAVLARRNLEDNGIAGKVYCGDLRRLPEEIPSGGFELVISNPPYFPEGGGKVAVGIRGDQRSELFCTPEELCRTAARCLKNGGRFAFSCRPERLAEWFSLLKARGIEPKRLLLIQDRKEIAPSAALVEGLKQGRSGLRVLPVKMRR